MILWKEASSRPRLLYLTAARDTIRQQSYLCKFLRVGGTRVPGNPVVSVSHATYMMMLILQRDMSLFNTSVGIVSIVLVLVHVERVLFLTHVLLLLVRVEFHVFLFHDDVLFLRTFRGTLRPRIGFKDFVEIHFPNARQSSIIFA